MTKRYPIFLVFLLLLSNTTNAMETSDDYLETLEAKFRQQTQTESDATESLLFNQFIRTQMALLLESPDNIEDLNQQIKRSREAMASDANDHRVDPNLHVKVQQSKAKHKALFDFVRRHQNSYSVDTQMLADFKAVEEFIEPIQISACVVHEGRTFSADEFFALDNVEPAKRDSVRIALFEQTKARAVGFTLERLPSEQAIQDLPASVQTLRTLQNYYTLFIRDYPDHEERSECEAKLAGSQKVFETFPPEYLKDQPSKKEIERISVVSFLRKIGYPTLQERFDSLVKNENPEEQLRDFLEIQDIGRAIEAYAQEYPTLDPEYSDLLHKAAGRIGEIFEEPASDQ